MTITGVSDCVSMSNAPPPPAPPPSVPEVAPDDTAHVVRVTLRLPYTVAEFDTVKQAAYREAVASAVGTVAANVDIVSIEGGRVTAQYYSPGVRVRTRMR